MNPHVHGYVDSHFDETVAYLKRHLPAGWVPEVAIVCGSGLGGLVDALEGDRIEISYGQIPNFCQSTGACTSVC